jgi:hypothetical protein
MQQKVFELVVSRFNTLSIAGVRITSEAREFDRLQVSKWIQLSGEDGRTIVTRCINQLIFTYPVSLSELSA